MFEIVNQSLQRIARGAGIVFAGTIISMLFGFLSCYHGEVFRG